MTELQALRQELSQLIDTVSGDGEQRATAWLAGGTRRDFDAGAHNLGAYLALRRHDLQPLQHRLAVHGLSSLHHAEGRVMPSLQALHAAVCRLAGDAPPPAFPARSAFFAGDEQLAANTEEIFGHSEGVSLLVTAPSEAATQPDFVRHLVNRGVEGLRINCAHDDEAAWGRMVAHVRKAEAATGRKLRIFMDLGGPKIRTDCVGTAGSDETPGRLEVGDRFVLLRPGQSHRHLPVHAHTPVAECTLAAPVDAAEVGHRVFYDDGKVGATVERCEAFGLVLRVTHAPVRGVRLRPEKGLNFPDSSFTVSALTEKDEQDLAFVARHADGVGFSFVQSPQDIAHLERVLGTCRRDLPEPLSVILKIETQEAVRCLPDLVAAAATRRPTAVMVARGDLAVEIGFARTAEMQEELLWVCEAAHVPVIWATQVLENFIKKRKQSRGEMTDAAMGARAECVMLNKGPYLLPAIDILQQLFPRMAGHLHKKTARLRPLQTWAKEPEDVAQ